MSITESSVETHGIAVDELNPIQRRAFNHLTSGHGDTDRRIATLHTMRDQGIFEITITEERARQLLTEYLENDHINCSAGKDRFRTVVFDTADAAPAQAFDQFRMVLAASDWKCTGSDQVDCSDCFGPLLRYEVHQVETDMWVQTWRAACQLANHRTRVTAATYAEYGDHLTFTEGGNPVHEEVPILSRRPEPTPTPEPEAPRRQSWFSDQRATYTFEHLARINVPTEQQFVPVEALLDAIAEYQRTYELCDAGVGEFLNEFGLSLTKRYEVIVEFKGHDGHRHEILKFHIETKEDPGDFFSDGDLDTPMNDAFEESIREWVADNGDGEISFIKGVDTYYRINPID